MSRTWISSSIKYFLSTFKLSFVQLVKALFPSVSTMRTLSVLHRGDMVGNNLLIARKDQQDLLCNYPICQPASHNSVQPEAWLWEPLQTVGSHKNPNICLGKRVTKVVASPELLILWATIVAFRDQHPFEPLWRAELTGWNKYQLVEKTFLYQKISKSDNFINLLIRFISFIY